MSNIRLATFRADVTPPIGHPLCAGWLSPAAGILDRLYALGIILLGNGTPIVLCAVDWCEISNGDHLLWREKLAAAADTEPERVAVQCLHPHNVPWPDSEAEGLVSQQSKLRHVMDVKWCQEALDHVVQAVCAAIKEPQSLTHIGTGEVKVEKIASNRRILGPDGRFKAVRWTICPDRDVRSEPEGLIDPMLKTVSFWNGEKKLAVLHYYAVHPCTTTDDGLVTSDFAGLARERRIEEDKNVPHIYFTGCAGNITPGKYNDGAPENKAILTERLYTAMIESERHIERIPADRLKWQTEWVKLPPRADLNEPDLLKTLSNPAESDKERIRAALEIVYLRRKDLPIPLTALHFGGRICLLHLPGEAFIEYQLYAQEQMPDRFVAVASYGDCGTGYIPMAESYAEGGYEPTDAFVSPEAEAIMKESIAKLVGA